MNLTVDPQQLRQWRKSLHLNQRQVARLIDAQQHQIVKIERQVVNSLFIYQKVNELYRSYEKKDPSAGQR